MNAANDHRLVIAVDGSDNSRRAVAYVGEFVGGLPGFSVVLVHVIHLAETDSQDVPEPRARRLRSERRRAAEWMDAYRRELVRRGMATDRIETHCVARNGPSLARLILAEAASRGARTIVVGRQGVSRKEEFLFGSVSKQIVSHAANCTVWVVQ